MSDKPGIILLNSYNSRVFSLVLFLVLAGWLGNAKAQMGGYDLSSADSINSTILPVLGYSSDIGFLGGAIYNRYNKEGKREPFKNQWQTLTMASTKGYIEAFVQYETTRTGQLPLRSLFKAEVLRIFEQHYFGIGNQTSFSQNLWDNEHYFYELRKYELSYKGRWQIIKEGRSKLDGLIIASLSYQKPYSRGDSTLFSLQQPVGSDGGWTNYIGTGVEYDSRDNENDPRKGYHLILQGKSAPSFLGSDYPHTKLKFDFSNYFSFDLGFTWTLANRLLFRHSFGDMAFWQ